MNRSINKHKPYIYCPNLLCQHSKATIESAMILYRIKDLVFRSKLTERMCHQCHRLFTELDWKEDNWEVSCRDLDWDNFAEGTSRGWLDIELELRHSNCPKKKSVKVKNMGR